MKRIDIVKKGNEWVAQTPTKIVVAQAPTKVEAIKKAAAVAQSVLDAVSVKIHKVNGRIQEERTYPRSADPRKSRG
jgi:methyl coenzyme M reductase beta subunit